MKFGKQLAKVIALSDAEWAPFWISYKALKKKIKELDPEQRVAVGAGGPTATGGGEGSGGEGQGSATNTEPTPKALAQSAGEVAFFKTIRAEIAKATEFYLGMEQQMGARKRRIRLGIQYLKQPTTVLEDDAWIKMRRACISLYKDLLLLENFAVMNYCACSKALKKHDKTVGLDTRARFMRNVVHQQPFTHYPRLLEMLQEMETTFQEINSMQGDSARPLEEEERLFLEAIRGLNQEASSMQREEKADLGSAAGGSGNPNNPSSDPEHSADDAPAGGLEAPRPPAAGAAGGAKEKEVEGGSPVKRPPQEAPAVGPVAVVAGGGDAGGGGKRQRV